MHNFTEISENGTNGIFFRDRENAGVKFFADRRNFSRVKIQFFKVVLCNQDARGGGMDGWVRQASCALDDVAVGCCGFCVCVSVGDMRQKPKSVKRVEGGSVNPNLT